MSRETPHTIDFHGRILVLGCGGVAQCTVPLLVRHLKMPPDRITVMDMEPREDRIRACREAGVQFRRQRLTSTNYGKVLGELLGPGDLFIDLSWNVETKSMLDWCHRHGVMFINTSVEEWDPYSKTGAEQTLYHRQMGIRRLVARWDSKSRYTGPTAVLDHGANPGLVSHFTKVALIEIAERIIAQKPRNRRVPKLQAALQASSYNQLAMLTGVKTIHISERDTQLSRAPKRVDEFVNTWSVEGFFEEAIAPAEIGWGTHERRLPVGAGGHLHGPANQIFLPNRRGMDTWVRSWVPGGQIHGMVIRHGEAFSISEFLTVGDDSQRVIYRPTVHYAYCPSDSAIASIQELRMRDLKLQDNMRILTDEVTEGADILGCLLMGHDFGAWWVGSKLDIKESRELVPGQNPTTLQVASSVLGAVFWMIRHPNSGVNLPDYLPHEEILDVARQYLGPFVSEPTTWRPVPEDSITDPDEMWQSDKFLVDDHASVFPDGDGPEEDAELYPAMGRLCPDPQYWPTGLQITTSLMACGST